MHKTYSGELSLILTVEQARYLYRLLGRHILGQGKYRDLNGEVFDQLDNYFDYGEISTDCPILPHLGQQHITLADDEVK